ncbi:MAG: topoisomerase C-terminal repeat-containing protein, partial [Gemmatimonadales bacterium]
DLTAEGVETLLRQRAEGPASLGIHPETGQPVYLLVGQYGPYVQLGEGEGKQKPKRASLPKGIRPEDVTLQRAIDLLSLPRLLGEHPDTGRPVKAGLGRFGPYVVHELGKGQADFRSIKAPDDVLTISFERALQLLAEPKAARGRRGAAATPLRELGVHPDDQQPVQLFDGKYGPYVKHGALNASLPRGADPQSFTLDQAVTLLAERRAAPPKARGTRRRRVPAS